MLKILRSWRTTGRAVAALPTPAAAGASPADVADERPLGCGWFDSSHELTHGLLVTEHASADAVAGQLALGDWLQLHLSGWHAPCAA